VSESRSAAAGGSVSWIAGTAIEESLGGIDSTRVPTVATALVAADAALDGA
jgi:hypothetical protein